MVLKNSIIFSCFVLLTFACQETAKQQQDFSSQTPAEQGASLYSMHCAQCHGEDGKLGASGAKDLSTSRLSDAQIVHIIKNGKGAMPAMEALLETEENLNLVLSHLKGLRR
jgi:mono/diheme cytochrome c family protein